MAKKKTSPSPAATPATTPTYVPMRSLLFGVSDGHFYAVKAYTKDNAEGRRDPETDAIIQEEIPAGQWEAGDRYDPYEFRLVEKQYFGGTSNPAVPQQNPSEYYPAEGFPTDETAASILSLVQRTFPGLNFENWTDSVNGWVYTNVVNPVIQGRSSQFTPGQVAVDIMVNGLKVALEKLAAQLRADQVLA